MSDSLTDPYSNVPQILKDISRWVCWHYEVRDNKPTKVPLNSKTGANADSTDPSTWSSYADALAAVKGNPPPKCEGIGFVLGGGFAGIDLDNALTKDGNLKPWAAKISERFKAAYQEISPSGTGIKIFFRGKKTGDRCSTYVNKANKAEGKIEMYDTDRFFTITNNQYGTGSIVELQAAFDKQYRETFETPAPAPIDFETDSGKWERQKLSDDDIIERIEKRDREGKLWRGDLSGKASQSEADLCLVGYIASQTDDRAQIDRIFRRSKLMRPKWDEKRGKQSYGDMTIDKAIKPSAKLHTEKEKIDYPMTDMGNAEFFIKLHGADFLYVVEWKSWLIWDGCRWKIDTAGARVHQRAMRFIQNDLLSHANSLKDDKWAARLKWAILSQQGKRLDVMLARASSLMAIDAEEMDRKPWLFNVKNGTIDLKTGELRRHDRRDMLTKLAPVNHDPSADCPIWKAFIERSVAPEVAPYLQKAVGYSMTGDCSEKACFIALGPSNTGKSTFSDTVKMIFGDYGLTAQQTVVLQTDKGSKTNSEDEANLMGMRFVSVSEPGEGQRWDEAKLKRMVPSNGSRIRARRLHENSFEYDATHKIWLDANHRPSVRGGSDDAIWNRIKLLPFENIVPLNERNGNLPTALIAEMSGILNWMLAGLKEWLGNGLAMNEPKTVRAAVNDYRVESDLLGQFLRDSVANNDAGRVDKRQLYQAYQVWCSENGVEMPLTSPMLAKKLAERGYKQDAGRRHFLGMDFLDCAASSPSGYESENYGKDDLPF